ncbi:alpha/beta hydrolase [Methanosarcina mazei]|uniref:Alpha/beta hydrolase n=1 Tax=Methanosarcina mazei TaxID=2209 RepID=A0A0F8I2U1_METMZ|nr:alpha/beta hydrolase [Methanosarcina mazei]KKG73674.1 alpha/beta hydrolase [Methanosarcina mazei]
MDKRHFYILNNKIRIPAILWGKQSEKLLIEVHGNLSSKEDTVISMMAQKAVEKGYQALSFDLPMHGERVDEEYACIPENCVSDLAAIYEYAKSLASDIHLFACSMGAYFSLLAYHDLNIKQSLFLSPIVDMERIISKMMESFQVSEERLKAEHEIRLPNGQVLEWNYYCYVRENPIRFEWKVPTAILYGSDDKLTELDEISTLADRYQSKVKVLEHGEHYFHTEEQLKVFDKWADENLL